MSGKARPPSFLAAMSPELRRYCRANWARMTASLELMPRRASSRWLRRVGGPAAAGLDPALVTKAVHAPSWHYLSRPGKMLRPLLCGLVAEAFGRRPDDFLPLLGMIELMECATISFDDIVDGSPLRRGARSTHDLYGVPVAYAASQALYHASWEAVFDPRLDVADAARAEILDTLAREIFAYAFGQCEELLWSREKKIVSEDQYLQMCWNRVVFLSFNGPVRIGALIGGCRPGPRLRALEEFAAWMGMAYHLHGDELNLLPRSQDWGKAVADDIPSGRVTLLFLHAYRRARGTDRRVLLQPFGDPEARSRDVAAAVDVIRASGAVERNRRVVEGFRRRARSRLRAARLAPRWSSLLEDALEFMSTTRTM